MVAIQSKLAGIALFRSFDAPTLREIENDCHVVQYDADEQVLDPAQTSTDVFMIIRGAVRVRAFAPDGREITYTELQAGAIFGEFSALDGGERSASVDTSEPSVLGRMTSSEFRALVTRYPTFGLHLAEHLVSRSRDMTRLLFEFGTMPVKDRLIAELLRLRDRSRLGDVIDPAPSHYELATRIATHREAVTREFAALTSAGIIETARRRIIITDGEALARLAREAGGTP